MISLRAGTHQMASDEIHVLESDLAALLLDGEALSNPSASLADVHTGIAYPAGLITAPVISGTRVRQTVGYLRPGRRYSLRLRATVTPEKVLSAEILIHCVY